MGEPHPRHRVWLMRGVLAAAALPVACRVAGVVAASVPMDGAFGIDATLDGKAVRVVLDTGSTHSALTRAVVDRLGLALRPAPEAQVTDASGVTRGVDGLAHASGLRIGATTWLNFEVPCLAFLAHFERDGLIGMEVLGSAVWWFDAPAKVVHVMPEAHVDDALAERGHRVLAKLPLGGDRARPFVRVRLEDKVDAELLLDTGAEGTSLPADLVATLALPPGDELARQRADERAARIQADLEAQLAERGSKVGVQVRVEPAESAAVGVHGVPEPRSLHHLRTLELGGQRFADMLVSANPRHGVLGRDVLGRLPWLLHGPRQELWVLAPR